MVTVACFCVGKELLIGKTLNSNAYWLGGKLFRIGVVLDRILVVTDSLEDISSGLRGLLENRPDFIIVIGGLGPTPDDMTLKGVALSLGMKLRLNRQAVSMMKAYYASTGREFQMTPARRKMAVLPEGATALSNSTGTAPGVRIERDGVVIYCLPGVPREMKSIYQEWIHPEIRKRVGKLYNSKVVMHLSGIYESNLAPLITEALKRHPSAYVKSHPKGIKEGRSSVELDIVVISPKKEDAEAERDALAEFFISAIGESRGTILKKTLSTAGR